VDRDQESCVSGRRILVLHAWMKGNLGDVLQLSVLLRALRELKPRALDLAGYPAQPAPETAEVTGLVDRYLPDTFPRYWSLAPAAIGRALFAPWWTRRRRALFSRYDAIVCAPGPYLAGYDPRAVSALRDIAVARELGLPVVLSSHSIGPLDAQGLAAVAEATLRVSRESATHAYLAEHGVSSVLAADLAFLYPYTADDGAPPVAPPYLVVFLRSNNLEARRLRITDGGLFDGSRPIAPAEGARLVLATSDRRRDAAFLGRLSRSLGIPWVACGSVREMVRLVRGSAGVTSDRYHPAICAAVLGKPAHVLPNREPHKMEGLRALLTGTHVGELQALARAGLDAVRAALREPA
jgi:polysaccharide pyruvyl transferase WcaK-like protein